MAEKRFFAYNFRKVGFYVLLVVLIWEIGSEGASIPSSHFQHTNLCSHIDPEPKVFLSNMFNTKDYFFPSKYTERKCASPKTKGAASGTASTGWPTCLNGKYHCVTRYRVMTFLRMPFPGNGTFAGAKVERLHVPVACECSGYTIV